LDERRNWPLRFRSLRSVLGALETYKQRDCCLEEMQVFEMQGQLQNTAQVVEGH